MEVKNLLIIGLLASEMNIKTGINERNATKRPFFKPISLDPKLARLCINLACGQIGEKAVLDPMCGTGGFAIEAITMGRNCVALDMQEQMTTGTKENIEFLFDGTNHIMKSLPEMLLNSVNLFLKNGIKTLLELYLTRPMVEILTEPIIMRN